MTSAWVVTSSAVVGSSASSSRGSVSSAAAIITRCSIPPDSSCGYWRSRRSPSSMPTWASISTARRLASAAADAEVGAQRLGHEVADPADRVDVRAGILEDHRDLVAVAAQVRPGQRGDVRAVEADRARRPRRPRGSSRPMARAVIDLPEPDSPTRPTASPGPTVSADVAQHGPLGAPRRAAARSGRRPRAAARSAGCRHRSPARTAARRAR